MSAAAHFHPASSVSYVNVLAIGTRVFVPRFGLGEAEDRLLAGLAADLAPGYEVIPVPARGILVRSGGIHCLFGVIRAEPSGPQMPVPHSLPAPGLHRHPE